MMTIALYCRVSTDEQAEHGFSIDHQKERLEAFCKSQGWSDFEFYIDDGYTGTNTQRPQLTRLIRHARDGRIDAVVVYKLDRLSRKQKDVLYLLEDVFEPYKVAFRSVTEPFDTSTPLGKAMIGILSVFAQLERDTIIERSRSGKRQRAIRGLWPGGPVPFGYEWDQDTQQLRVKPNEADIMRGIFERIVRGESYPSIAKWAAKRSEDRAFSHHKTIYYMVNNPVYAGKLRASGSDELVDGRHDPIIDEQTWQRAIEEVNRRTNGRRPYGRYMLSNLLVCGVCGQSMKHTTGRKNGVITADYYICKSKHTNHACDSKYYRAAKIEAAVIDYLQSITTDPKRLQDVLQAADADPSIDDAIMAIEQETNEITRKLNRWYAAFEDGTFAPDEVRARVDSLLAEKKALNTRLDELHDEKRPTASPEDLQTMLRQIEAHWDDMKPEEHNMVLRAMIENIVVFPDFTLEFQWNI